MRKLSNVLILSLVVTSAQFASAGELDYPELAVTPRASERVKLEASKENHERWTRHAAIQASALTTFIAAATQTNTTTDNSNKLLGFAVGGGWIVTTLALSNFYTPFISGQDEINALPAKSQREILTRERTAEETINRASKLGSRLSWISFTSNFVASGYLLARADKTTKSFGIDILAVAASFAPLIFPSNWQTIASDHREYKKRIYGPVASAALLPDVATNTVVPGVALSMRW